MTKTIFLANAFSLQMLSNLNSDISITKVDKLPTGLVSAIGHADTAAVLGVDMNRVNVSLSDGDALYVAQLTGGRLPEGSTTLPDGFSFVFLRIDVKCR